MGATALFVSPHLDDVAFSCGATLARLARRGWRTVLVTVFTATVPNPTGFALACQTDKGLGPEVDYMRLRRAEDRVFAGTAGIERLAWLGYPEAPHRGYADAAALFAGVRPDDDVWRAVARELSQVADAERPEVVFAPQGLGGHVDHLQVVRAVGAAGLGPVAWYRDTPYVLREPDARPRWPGTVDVAVPVGDTLAVKLDGVSAYATQLGFQFGGAPAMRAALRDFAATEGRRHLVGGPAEVFAVAAPVDFGAYSACS